MVNKHKEQQQYMGLRRKDIQSFHDKCFQHKLMERIQQRLVMYKRLLQV